MGNLRFSTSNRSLAGFATIFALLLPCTALAQDADDAYTLLVMKAIYAHSLKDYGKAEQIFLEAVHEAERFGPNDARLGVTLNSLGLAYRDDHKYLEAENSYRRALAILEKAYGPDSIDVANVNFNIATVLFDEGHQGAAMPFLQKLLPTYEGMFGGTSLKTAAALCMVGDAHRALKNYADAEGPLRRCADIRESSGGIQSLELADALHSLALVYTGQGKYALAEPRLKLAEKIRESGLGITSPLLAQTMEDHANLLKQMGRDHEAERLAAMAAAIRRSEKRPPDQKASR